MRQPGCKSATSHEIPPRGTEDSQDFPRRGGQRIKNRNAFSHHHRTVGPAGPERAPRRPHFSQGNEHYELGCYEEAAADYGEAIRLRPDYIEAYYNRGSARAELGRYEKASADLKTALELAQTAGNDGLAAKIEETLNTVKNS